jgi:hypothetical protein
LPHCWAGLYAQVPSKILELCRQVYNDEVDNKGKGEVNGIQFSHINNSVTIVLTGEDLAFKDERTTS